MIRMRAILSVSLLGLCFMATMPAAHAFTLTARPYQALSGFEGDDLNGFFDALERSCTIFKRKQSSDYVHKSKLGGKIKDWLPICAGLSAIKYHDISQQRAFIERSFTPYQVINDDGGVGKFTGYFEASLEGDTQQSEEYPYPVYRLPKGLASKQPFYTRKQIDAGTLEGQGLELLWVNDDVKLFFAHVQGSATVKMRDGSLRRIGYAGKTSHPYYAIGRFLIEHGHIAKEDMNAESIKAWLYLNADQRHEVFAQNPSYIFFRDIKSQSGPIGGQNVPLTAERSLAVDKGLIPYGAPIWLETTRTYDGQDYHRLMVAQDTGSAIKGAVRGDIFYGYGVQAEQYAAHQHSEGTWFLLLPKHVRVE